MLDPSDAFNSILTRLRTGPWTVYEDQAPEDDSPVWGDGLFVPFLVVSFGGPFRAARDRSLITTRWDPTVLTLLVESHAPRSGDARTISGRVINMMTGFYPEDSGELTLEMTGARTKAANNIRPTTYIVSTGFSCVSNLSTE